MVQEIIQLNMEVVSGFGSIEPLFIFSVIFIAGFLAFKNYLKQAILALATLGSYFYSVVLKFWFKIPRPKNAPVLTIGRFEADKYGFPSSHTVMYTVFWGFLIYLLFRVELFKKCKFLKTALFIISTYFLLLVGFSRVYLNYHSIRDVAAGYLFGGIYLGVLILLDRVKVPFLETESGEEVLSENQEQNN